MNRSEHVALVTAATDGIGRGIAEALVSQGHHVIISGRTEEKGHRAVTEIAAGGSVSYVRADSMIQQQVEGLVDSVIQSHGRLDVLVNNAGGSHGFAPVHELGDAAWTNAFQLNVSSAFWAVRRAVPYMIKSRFGRIINISSIQGKQVNRPNAAHYVMAKHAINGFTKAVAFEYGKVGITCNALCIGAIETDLMRTAGAKAAEAGGLTYEQYKQRYADQAMTGRLNTVEEVASLALLLASDAGAGITGAVLNVDGGCCPY